MRTPYVFHLTSTGTLEITKNEAEVVQMIFVGVQYKLYSRERKKQKDAAKSVKVQLPHLTQPRGDHILHEQEYNTGHDVQAIPNEIRGEVWRQPSQPEVQQGPVVCLLLACPLGWECGISGLPVTASSQPSKPAYRSGAEVDSGYTPQSTDRPGGAVAPPEATRLYPPT